MKEGEGSKKWLAITILIIIIILLILFVICLPLLISGVKADDNSLIIELQIAHSQAYLTLPHDLAKFYSQAKIDLSAPPYLTRDGFSLMAVRDLEKLLNAQVNWWPRNRNIQIIIPPGIIQKNQLSLILTPDTYTLKDDKAFVSIRLLSKLLGAKLAWYDKTKGIRLTWSRNFAP